MSRDPALTRAPGARPSASENQHDDAAVATVRVLATFITAVVIGLITLGPQPGDPNQPGGLQELFTRWHGAGLPAWIDLPLLEFCANIALFVPVGAVAASWLRSWGAAVFAGAAVTSFIECFQGLFLPDRVADPRDLLSNTLGAALGAAALLALRRRAARGHAGASPHRHPRG
ncbi:VanZ family protein [Galactobacter valiniphilus]|uniref:VanZ family protein n=1 Tax=Galactobacter valiniphilus TaxID=2676122 RepID=UPI003734F089